MAFTVECSYQDIEIEISIAELLNDGNMTAIDG